jgi:predicted secreted hydrolase
MKSLVLLTCAIATTMAITAHAQEPDPLAGTMAQNVLDDRFGEPRHITLPADDSAHSGYFVEWWQWWLHLETEDGEPFGSGVMFVHFPLDPVLGAAGVGIRRTDVKVADVSDGSFHFDSKYSEEPVAHVPNGFDLAAVGQRAKGGDGHDVVHIEVDGYSLDVQIDAQREPVLLFNPDGFYRPDPVESVRIYERQRMATQGTLQKGGKTVRVSGSSWFEHGWGNIPSIVIINWDYFQLELDDGRDIEVAQVRRIKGAPVYLHQGQIRDENGGTTYLHEGDIEITSTGTWSRDATCTYPSGWQIRIKDEHFTITPILKDQEVRNPVFGHFWDGDTVITGSATGRGIAEPLNYCYTPRPQDALE